MIKFIFLLLELMPAHCKCILSRKLARFGTRSGIQYTVCPGSCDPPEKILNIFPSENEVYTIFSLLRYFRLNITDIQYLSLMYFPLVLAIQTIYHLATLPSADRELQFLFSKFHREKIRRQIVFTQKFNDIDNITLQKFLVF